MASEECCATKISIPNSRSETVTRPTFNFFFYRNSCEFSRVYDSRTTCKRAEKRLNLQSHKRRDLATDADRVTTVGLRRVSVETYRRGHHILLRGTNVVFLFFVDVSFSNQIEFENDTPCTTRRRVSCSNADTAYACAPVDIPTLSPATTDSYSNQSRPRD